MLNPKSALYTLPLTALVFSSLLAACSASHDIHTITANERAAIIDGTPAKPQDLISKSTVFILRTDGSDCTGEVLSSDVILTAAHCLVKEDSGEQVPAERITVLDAPTGNFIPASMAVANPVYLLMLKEGSDSQATVPAYSGRDVALLKLSKPLSSSYQPMELAQNFDQSLKQPLKIAGFGGAHTIKDSILKSGSIEINGQDHVPGTPYATGAVANANYARIVKFVKTDQDAGFCHGDSGGPLYYEANGKIKLVALDVDFVDADEKKLCASGQTVEFATLLMNENLAFVQDVFKALTKQDLPGVNLSAESTDPLRFASYFGKNSAPSANRWLDLNVVILDSTFKDDQGHLSIIAPAPKNGANACDAISHTDLSFINYDEGYSLKQGDGSNVTVLQYRKGLTSLKSTFEVHVKATDNEVEIVALTPDGFLHKSVPKVSCHYNQAMTDLIKPIAVTLESSTPSTME